MNTTTADAGSETLTDTVTDQAYDRTGQPYDSQPDNSRPRARRLSRAADGAMLGGVAAGLARYLDADVTLVRVIIAALTLISGSGAALYLAAWLLIPRDGQDESIAAVWLAGRRGQAR